jgi:hypothetical protein
MDKIKKHIHISSVPGIGEPDTLCIWNYHIDRFKQIPDLPADEDLFPVPFGVLR